MGNDVHRAEPTQSSIIKMNTRILNYDPGDAPLDMPVRTKFLLVYTLIAAALTLVCFLFQDKLGLRDPEEKLHFKAALLSSELTGALASGDQGRAQKVLDALRFDPDVVTAQVILNDGATFASYLKNDPGHQDLRAANYWENFYIVRNSIGDADGDWGYVEMYARVAQPFVHYLAWTVAASFALLGVGVWILAGWLQNSMVSPIVSMARRLGELRRENEFELPESQSPDEIGVLNQEINALLRGVKHRDWELREQVADLTRELNELNKRFSEQAYHDSLTMLPNRALFDDRLTLSLAQAERSGKLVAVMFLDIDRFKNVNDTMGHEVGDELLMVFAERLRKSVRKKDTVARLGGDEFTVVLTDIESAKDASQIAESIMHTLTEPLEINGIDMNVSASIGISIFPLDGTDVTTLKRNADTAMYHAKEQGRNGYQFYSDEMNVKARERLLLESELKRAIEHHEFAVLYQPQVDLGTTSLVGFEALARWRHPQRGLVGPAEFIDMAEDVGLITEIDRQVLQQVCAMPREWSAITARTLRIAVNLSTRSLLSPNLVSSIANILKQNNLDPGTLELEITESSIMHNAEMALVTLKALRDLGVRLAVDDFGTGYSSLSYLKRFPIDTIKIDRSFVRDIATDPDDAAIIKAIAVMAKSLNLEVVAEGVETLDQIEFLQSLDCRFMQGYFFSRPITNGEVCEFIRKEPWKEALKR